MRFLKLALTAGALAAGAHGAGAAIVISEVDPFGSNGSTGYVSDWFELTNTGSTAVSIAGWTMMDNHAASNSSNPYAGTITANSTAAPLTLANGVTSLAAGQSAIFIESSANAAGSTALIQSFETAWFGTHVPGNLLIGTAQDGGSFGLSQTADMVNIFNGSTSGAALEASVAFGADSGNPTATFDNTAGLNDTTLTLKSVAGVNGAFLSASGLEVGSPGVVPLPGSALLMLSGLAGLGWLLIGRTRAGRVCE